MESKANYSLVGLIVILLTIALVATCLWLSVGLNKKTYRTYAVYLSEAAAGLSDESPVKFNGVQVGYVKKIALDKTDPRKVELLLSIEEGTPVTATTTATLISQGITGTTYVGLKADSDNLAPLEKKPEEPYPVIPATPSLFNQLDTALKDVSQNINAVSIDIRRMFDKQNARYVRQTLKNIDAITHSIAANESHIARILDQTDVLSTKLAKASTNLPQLIDDGDAALRAFKQEAIPEAITLLHRLNRIAQNIEGVSEAMKQNPSVLIRGSQSPKPGPGER